MNETQNWYYTDASGQQAGPITAAELQQRLSNGSLSTQTMVWSEGMTDWVLASTVGALSSTPTHGAPQAANPANPYAPPQTHVTAPVSDDDYPIADVKRTNYGLFAGTFITGFILLVIGFAILTVNQESSSYNTPSGNPYGYSSPNPSSGPSPVSILTMLAGFGFLLWGGILGLIYLHRAWRLVQPGGAATTPGKAVGFLFIPIFSIFWTFIAYWKWSQDWNRISSSYRKLAGAPRATDGLFLAYAIIGAVGAFVGLIGLVSIVFYLIIMKQVCNIVNHMHDLRLSNPNQNPGGLGLY